MILIITHKEDYTVDFVVNKFNKLRIPYRRFNCEDIYNNRVSIKIDPLFSYSILENSEYDSIWFRRTKLPQVANLCIEEQLYLQYETESLFKNLFSTLTSKWLSLPEAVYRAENKLFQLKIANEIGFKIPKTLVTNSKMELIDFYKNVKNVILKPISQTRIQYKNKAEFIFTNTLTKEIIDKIEDFDLTPCIFQENIAKEYEIRVTVVNNDVFAACVDSQSHDETRVDWRRKKIQFTAIILPNEIGKKCQQMVQKLNLNFGAIDLIRTPSGDYVFLEINPNGQWAWIENQTNQNISGSIIKFLTN
jgi:hypothetical protein